MPPGLLRRERLIKRIVLFVMTNLAILVVLSIALRLLGIDRYLAAGGGLNVGALLVFAAVIGFGGSLISLALSKWSAKMMVGAQVISSPSNPTERWLLETVQRHAQQAGIGMPEVAIYEAPEINAFATGARRDNALVAVSTGLLQNMAPDEAAAVLGHEISHVANGDMVTLALIQGVLNTFVIFFARIIGNMSTKPCSGASAATARRSGSPRSSPSWCWGSSRQSSSYGSAGSASSAPMREPRNWRAATG